MANLKYTPISHDHQAFLAKAGKRKGFETAYESLELEYQLVSQLLKARSRAGCNTFGSRCMAPRYSAETSSCEWFE